MDFDSTDLKSILVSVAGSVLFALLVYFFHGYWKNKSEKEKEKNKQLEIEADKKKHEEFEIEKIRQHLSEANKLYANGMYYKSLEKCKDILAHTNVQKYAGLYWSVKLKEGESYFDLRLVDAYENNCLHAIEAFLICLTTVKQLDDIEADGLTHMHIGNAYAALSHIRSKEQNLDKAITHLKLALQQFEASSSSVMIREVQRYLAKAYDEFSTIREKEAYLMLSIDAHRASLSGTSENENDDYIRTSALAMTLVELSHLKDGENNLNEAIGYLKKAVDNISIEDNAGFLAETQTNLACAYGYLSEIKDKESNLEKAIYYTSESLKIITSKDYPYYYALAKSNLGILLLKKLQIDQIETNDIKLVEAINHIQESLNFLSIKDYPLNYADCMMNLGEAYTMIASFNNKHENIKTAISHYESAKRVYTLAKYPDVFNKCSDYIRDLEESLLDADGNK
jgi:hypothetical protein